MKRSTTNIFFLSIISSLCLHSSLLHGMEERIRSLKDSKFKRFLIHAVEATQDIKLHAEEVKDLTPHQQLASWADLWHKKHATISGDRAKNLAQHIELLLRKHSGLSFASAGITKEQFVPTEIYGIILLESACAANMPFFAQQLIELHADSLNSDRMSQLLRHAALKGHTQITQMLLDAGIHEINYAWFGQPLSYAATEQYCHDVRLLLLKRAQRNNYKPLKIIEGFFNTNEINVHERIIEQAQENNNPTTLQLLDCATTQPHKLAKLGYPVELLPAQLPHIMMMRERGVRYSGDRVGRIQRQMGRMEMQELQEF